MQGSLFAARNHIITDEERVKVRSGAGNYYEVITALPKGTELEIIEEIGKWYKVKLAEELTGYVSKRAIKERKENREYIRTLPDEKEVGGVSSAEIVAVTKGLSSLDSFAIHYAEKHNIETTRFEQLQEVPFTPEEYESFKKGFKNIRKVEIKGINTEGIRDIDRTIGAPIALRISSLRICPVKGLRKYVSMVGTAVVENTPFYDESFMFIVLGNSSIESFAVPGGYIFITAGAVESMKNEAELAGVLAHEITHVVQRHGIKELEKQGIGEGDKAAVGELSDITDQMYELITNGRKQETEDESDKIGTLFLYNTGYAPDGLKEFLHRLDKMSRLKPSKIMKTHRPFRERASLIGTVIKEYKLSTGRGADFRKRFQIRTQ